MTQEHASINGALLRLRREARGWVQSDVATRACMSVKQIRQLEEGGLSAFYSEAVKVTAAKKVGALLGLTQDEVFSHGQPEVAMATSSLSPEEDLATLLASTHSGEDEPQSEIHPLSAATPAEESQGASFAHEVTSAHPEHDVLNTHSASHSATPSPYQQEAQPDESEQTTHDQLDGHTGAKQLKAVSASSASASTGAALSPSKSKVSLVWIMVLFVGAIVLAAVLRPDPEPIATEPPPPLQPALQGEPDAPKEGASATEGAAAPAQPAPGAINPAAAAPNAPSPSVPASSGSASPAAPVNAVAVPPAASNNAPANSSQGVSASPAATPATPAPAAKTN